MRDLSVTSAVTLPRGSHKREPSGCPTNQAKHSPSWASRRSMAACEALVRPWLLRRGQASPTIITALVVQPRWLLPELSQVNGMGCCQSSALDTTSTDSTKPHVDLGHLSLVFDTAHLGAGTTAHMGSVISPIDQTTSTWPFDGGTRVLGCSAEISRSNCESVTTTTVRLGRAIP